MSAIETTDVALYGKTPNQLRTEETYVSPDEYADQGDERVIKDLLFTYHALEVDVAGNKVPQPVQLQRDAEITIDQIGLLALIKGEKHGSFYTTEELKRREQTGSPDVPITSESNLSELGEFELAEWLNGGSEDGKPPTIDEVLASVGTDKDLAARMLAAENIRGDGDPRKGLVAGLTDIIQHTE